MQDSIAGKPLDYCGAIGPNPENVESFAFHSSLLLSQLASLDQVDDYHKSLPWRIVWALDHGSWPELLKFMAQTWDFVLHVHDKLRTTEALYKELMVCRFPCFRDVLIKGEYLGENPWVNVLLLLSISFMVCICQTAKQFPYHRFTQCSLSTPRQFAFRPEAMTQEDSLEFRKLVRAVAGMTGKEPSSLLSSLPCELAFNDLRDSSRRHQKMEKTCPQNLHAVSYKSSLVRTCGCKTLPLTDSDWASMMNVKAVKKTVFCALRASDIQLGVSSEGLTRHKTNADYTKPHIFCNRLRLLETLKSYYLEQSGDADERRAKVISAHRSLWLSRLIPNEVFVRFKAQDDQNPEPPVLVIRAGPHSILGVTMEKIADDPATFTFPSLSPPRKEQLVLDHTKVEICATQPVVSEVDSHCLRSGPVLSWQERGPW